MKCPSDCVNCALKGHAFIEPPAQKNQGTEGILFANFKCLTGAKIGDVSMHSFPENRLEQLLIEREKILNIMEKI